MTLPHSVRATYGERVGGVRSEDECWRAGAVVFRFLNRHTASGGGEQSNSQPRVLSAVELDLNLR